MSINKCLSIGRHLPIGEWIFSYRFNKRIRGDYQTVIKNNWKHAQHTVWCVCLYNICSAAVTFVFTHSWYRNICSTFSDWYV